MKTKKMIVITISILLLCMLSVSEEFNVYAELSSNDSTSSNGVNSILNTKPTPLTASDIAKAWPNLPSATQIYNSGYCSIVNLNTFGKSVPINATTGFPESSGINPNSSSCYDASSVIANCTSTSLNYQTGQYVSNVPTIWLQYNSTIWVQVPYNDLKTSVQPYATAIAQELGNGTSTSPMTTTPTWSIGE